ncbi:hypothetical protein VNO77_04477 [Canavalia gladiata]|uniref:Uncharacterized protein n=1 Tax=Canavalia gladiata TaxID=3824 RepID=A0AAN9MYL4_CANGL
MAMQGRLTRGSCKTKGGYGPPPRRSQPIFERGVVSGVKTSLLAFEIRAANKPHAVTHEWQDPSSNPRLLRGVLEDFRDSSLALSLRPFDCSSTEGSRSSSRRYDHHNRAHRDASLLRLSEPTSIAPHSSESAADRVVLSPWAEALEKPWQPEDDPSQTSRLACERRRGVWRRTTLRLLKGVSREMDADGGSRREENGLTLPNEVVPIDS